MRTEYARIWEFVVVPDHAYDFERAYGPFGDWVQLFRRSTLFLRLALHRDLQEPRRFMTIDYWESQESIEGLRGRYAAEFEALESRCERYFDHRAAIGRFEMLRYGQYRAIGPR